MEAPEITFMFQFGSIRDAVTVCASQLNLRSLKELACNFIETHVSVYTISMYIHIVDVCLVVRFRECMLSAVFACHPHQAPNNGLSQLPDRLLLFRHDYSSANVLHIVSNAAEVIDETIIEIVLTASRKFIFSKCILYQLSTIIHAILNDLHAFILHTTYANTQPFNTPIITMTFPSCGRTPLSSIRTRRPRFVTTAAKCCSVLCGRVSSATAAIRTSTNVVQ